MSGIVAIGDSIINGHGDPMVGVQCQSPALWLSRAGDWPLSIYSVGGARSEAIVEQLANVRDGYAVAIFDAGVNDVLTSWDADVYAEALETIATRLTSAAEKVVVLTLPALPGKAAAVTEANALIRSAAARHDLLVVDLDDFSGARRMTPDHIHPNALGLLEIAERAAVLLGMERMPASVTLGNPRAKLPATEYMNRWVGLWKNGLKRLARRALGR